MSLLNEIKLLRVSDLRGLAQLATQATARVTRIAEGVHHAVLGSMGLRGSAVPALPICATATCWMKIGGARTDFRVNLTSINWYRCRKV